MFKSSLIKRYLFTQINFLEKDLKNFDAELYQLHLDFYNDLSNSQYKSINNSIMQDKEDTILLISKLQSLLGEV